MSAEPEFGSMMGNLRTREGNFEDSFRAIKELETSALSSPLES
jgi:hypothetical protein